MSILLTNKQRREVKQAAALASMPQVDCLLSASAVAARLSIGTRTLWRMVAQGIIPQPIRYTRKLVRWPSAAIQRYLDGLLTPPAA